MAEDNPEPLIFLPFSPSAGIKACSITPTIQYSFRTRTQSLVFVVQALYQLSYISSIPEGC